MSDEKLEIINPPNALKQKVGTGGPGAVDLEALERAEQVIAGMTDSYLEWVVEDLKKIEAAYNALASASGDGREEMQAVFQVAHDIKGQGGSFGYETNRTWQPYRRQTKRECDGRQEAAGIFLASCLS